MRRQPGRPYQPRGGGGGDLVGTGFATVLTAVSFLTLNTIGGGGGGGISISPVAFIVIQGEKVRMMQINNYTSSADRAIAMIPELVDQLSQLLKAKDSDKPAEEAAPEK